MNAADWSVPSRRWKESAVSEQMKIYLAARYSRGPELRTYREILCNMGHVVTSRWLDGGHEIKPGGSDQAADHDRQRFAVEDWSDMLAADCVISFTEEPRKTNTRGGRHVEFGGAVALNKRCIIVGWRENVFHHLPHVEFHPSWAGCLSSLEASADLAITPAEATTHWAITSPSGMHIGLWTNYATAKRVFDNETNGSTLTPLRTIAGETPHD